MTRIWLSAAVVAMSLGSVEAALVYDSQARSVRATGYAEDFINLGYDGYDKRVTADPGDFSPFDHGVSGSATVIYVWCDSSATQVSTLGSTRITAAGSAAANVTGDPMYGNGGAMGNSDMTAVFHVMSPTQVLLSGRLHELGNWYRSASLSLKEDGVVILSRSTDLSSPVIIDYAHTLMPGSTYELSVHASAGGAGSNGYDIALEIVPEPGALVLLALGLGLLARRRSAR